MNEIYFATEKTLKLFKVKNNSLGLNLVINKLSNNLRSCDVIVNKLICLAYKIIVILNINEQIKEIFAVSY